ncbi:hypothetical protein V22_11180 [Calycomorphotria hydatis]|uniref:3-keto-alpha-glucoside-1,2-lyase/3-keto-2-hydroxy-glucal hydratase domain-containing protein n=2 Tax=Calycomorphotria hydatis TaxID=2528027 RepID=A0A517T6A9_9PLAN|nr:DUF1080 domain-containing protein [Calycomorphotria hydatis]QDT63891.1 hypothetical protein V22_11180 [Calycomorphotria hydatis]
MNYSIKLMALLCFLTLNGLADAGEWRSLFNGKDLTGWTPKIVGHEAGDNFGDTFRVEDGVIKVSYDHYDKFDRKFGHLFYNEPFSHYRLRIEYRFVGDQAPGGEGWAFRNSGAMLHGQTPESMGLDQDFPDSIEGQFLGGKSDGKKRSTANLCTPGTDVIMDGKLRKKHCTSSSSKTYDGDQWVTVEFEVRGSDSIKHYVNGDLVLEYTKPQLDDGTLLESGTISLQSESHPIEFRKVEIMELDAE